MADPSHEFRNKQQASVVFPLTDEVLLSSVLNCARLTVSYPQSDFYRTTLVVDLDIIQDRLRTGGLAAHPLFADLCETLAKIDPLEQNDSNVLARAIAGPGVKPQNAWAQFAP